MLMKKITLDAQQIQLNLSEQLLTQVTNSQGSSHKKVIKGTLVIVVLSRVLKLNIVWLYVLALKEV